jgi:spore coat polysaccharide biosynthesis protein SpsF
MKIGAIIQARTGSTRLPSKVLMEIQDKKVLEHVVERVKQASSIDEIIIATTKSVGDNAIEEIAKLNGWALYRGSEEDVLSRYYEAAKLYQLDIIIRITSDCPLIDPIIIDKMVEVYKTGDYDLVTNAGEECYRTFPRGLDAEVFSFAVLEETMKSELQVYHREHVTPYIYETGKVFYYKNSEDFSEYRLTLDTLEDFHLINSLYKELYHGEHDFYLKDIIKVLIEKPELCQINKQITQKKIK